MKIVLKGIAWAHTRALAPLQVTSRVYTDFHPEVSITWDIRSLQAFGEGSIEELTRQYDFLLIDYPFIGAIAESNMFIPLNEVIDDDILLRLSDESVGPSYNSYYYKGQQWAVPIDAAAQVACSRNDLLTAAGYSVPGYWHEVMELAKETERVAMPMTPMGLLGTFFTLCANQGEVPFSGKADILVSHNMAEHVLSQLKDLYELIPEWCLNVYPPEIFNKMITTGDIWYVPISYGYVNYSMRGYAKNLLTAHDIPAAGNLGCKGATLGGVGIALSSSCKYVDHAVEYISTISNADCQKTIYGYSGGQAANKEAWIDDTLNSITNNFYRNTLSTMEQSFVRPRYSGFHGFQSIAGRTLQSFLRNEFTANATIEALNEAFKRSAVQLSGIVY